VGGDGRVETLLAKHHGLVRSFFRRRCACPEDAEDLAQETFCAIVSAWPRFRGGSAPSTWVWAICRNIYSNHLYTKRRRERLVAELGSGLAAAGDGQDPPGADLALVLDGLSPEERRLYECYYGEGLSVRKTAVLLERPEGTVKYLLFRLRARVRDLLEERAGSAARPGAR
jgi:RNA polymerase sigma-70 factor (ECF subfamily)